MKIERMINAVDSHTAGEPTRVIVGGMPHICGNTMVEKMQHLSDHLDYVRQGLMNEPRGHNDMFGAILMEPCRKEADLGIVFMHSGGYANMCGHGTVGAATVAVETGMIPKVEPETKIVFDTPAGLVEARAKVSGGHVVEVTVQNVPAYLALRDRRAQLADGRTVRYDVAFGGSFFALVAASDVGLQIRTEDAGALRAIGMELLSIINRQEQIQHPQQKHIHSIDLVEFYEMVDEPGLNAKNMVIFGKGEIDRSPCGTGTSAKLASLYFKGALGLNEEFVYQSILGTRFRGLVLGELEIDGQQYIRPQITGSAYITGFQNFAFMEDDPLKYGFRL